MTKEELKEFANTEEGKAAFSEVATEIGYETPEAIGGLKRKNTELLHELKKFKEENSAKLAVDLDRYNELLDMEASGQMGKADSELRKEKAKLEREMKVLQEENGRYKSTLDTLQEKENNNLIEKTIETKLRDCDISDVYYKTLTKSFRGGASLVDGQVYIKDDTGKEIHVDDYFKQWSGTEEAKAFSKANSGANVKPSSNGKPTATKTIAECTSREEKIAFIRNKINSK